MKGQIIQMARRFAETMLYWKGHLRAQEIQEFLGVSERTARTMISQWRDQGLLPPYRNYTQRRLVPPDGFDPGPPVSDSAITYVLLLVGKDLPGNPFSSFGLPCGGHDLSLTARISTGPGREIIAACLENEPLKLIYAAKSGIEEFVFSPSALVRSRGRYHLRGFRADGRDAFLKPLDDRYVDIVPARAIEASRATTATFVGLDGDDDWHTIEESRFRLSPELAEVERSCYEHEYGIADTGFLLVKERRALMTYVRQELSERRCWRRDGTSVPVWAESALGAAVKG